MNIHISRRTHRKGFKYEHGPFGEVFCSVGDMAKVNPFGFSTKYTDNETDLVYYGYRYYSPALGRWLSRDPIEEQGGLNLYGFVNNDPVNKWDKLGLFWEKEKKERDNKKSNPYAENLRNSAQDLSKFIISNEDSVCCTGMRKAAAKISSSLLLLADAKSSIENMEYVAGVCATFAKSPSIDGCLLCCNGIVNSFPAIKGISYFWCNKHCANFL